MADPEPGGGAARVAAGMLAAVTELHYGEQLLLGLNLASAARYPAFVAELEEASGRDTGFRTCGTLAVALDADDRAHLRELHALQERSGLESVWLNGRECRRLEPMLAPGVRGGLRVDGDHQVDPRRLAAALLTACERAGVAFRRTTAERLTVTGDRAAGALLGDGTAFAAGQVVLAAGSLSGRLAGLPPELVPPVRPVKGQVLRLTVPPAYAPSSAAPCVRWSGAATSTSYRVRTANWSSARPARRWAGTPRSPRAGCTSCCATPMNWCPGSPSCR